MVNTSRLELEQNIKYVAGWFKDSGGLKYVITCDLVSEAAHVCKVSYGFVFNIYHRTTNVWSHATWNYKENEMNAIVNSKFYNT